MQERDPLSEGVPSVEQSPSIAAAELSAAAETEPQTQLGSQPQSEPSVDEELDEEFLKRKPRKSRQKATKAAASKPREEYLPDLGDGTGYVPPDPNLVSKDEAHWYVVHCYSGYENKVKNNLEQRIETMGMADKILEVVVPTENEIEMREGKRRTVEKRILPGYVLVRMKMSEDSWHVVRNTPGVTRFAGMGNQPQPLDPEEVQKLLSRKEAEAPKIKVNFRIGQKVRIIEGPFADFVGVVDKIDTERAKVTVLVSFFGRETPFELDFIQVERM